MEVAKQKPEHTRRVLSKEYAALKRAATNRATLEARHKAEVDNMKHQLEAMQKRIVDADADRDFWRKKCEQYHRMILREM